MLIFGVEFLNRHQGKVNQLAELGLKPSPDTLVDGRHSILRLLFIDQMHRVGSDLSRFGGIQRALRRSSNSRQVRCPRRAVLAPRHPKPATG